jgi:hypothetical protein
MKSTLLRVAGAEMAALCGRAEAHVPRFSLIYALLDDPDPVLSSRQFHPSRMNAEPSMSESPERKVTSLLQAWGKVLDVSVATVHRDWQLAKVWLMRELSKENRRGA